MPGIATLYTSAASQKDFVVGFPYLDKSDLRVYDDGVLQVLGTNYYIQDTAQQGQDGGAKNIIHFPTSPGTSSVIRIQRNSPLAVRKPTLEIGHSDFKQALFKFQEMVGDAGIGGRIPFFFNQTDLLAPTAFTWTAPFDGYINSLETAVNKAVTTGGVVTVEVATVAVTGLSITIPDSAIVGSKLTDTPTTPLSSTTKFRAGQAVTVTPGAPFATAGELGGLLYVTPADL